MGQSEKRKRWLERRAKRIEAHWPLCRDWFGGTGVGTENIELHLVGAGVDRLKKALRAVERFTKRGFSGSVWADPDSIDTRCRGHDAFVDQIEAGKVIGYHVNYEVTHGDLTFPVLLSIKRLKPEGVDVVATTGHDLLVPERTTLRQRFEAVMVHGIDLEQWFFPCLLLIAVRGEDKRMLGKAWIG